jgi:hypothetical protein
LNTGTHLKILPVPTLINAAASFIGSVVIGGISYNIYDIVYSTASVAPGTSTTITIQ